MLGPDEKFLARSTAPVLAVAWEGIRMKTFVSILVLTVTTSALAANDYDRFAKVVSRYATKLGGEPKGLCLCRDASLARSVGFLILGTSAPISGTTSITSTMSCHVPGFDETSLERGPTFACQDFVPVAK